jgi:hypothetical protein
VKAGRNEEKKVMKKYDHGSYAAQRFQLDQFATTWVHHVGTAEASVTRSSPSSSRPACS